MLKKMKNNNKIPKDWDNRFVPQMIDDKGKPRNINMYIYVQLRTKYSNRLAI